MGVFRNFSRGGLNFFIYRGAQHPLGTEIHRFYWSRGGAVPPFTFEYVSAREDMSESKWCPSNQYLNYNEEDIVDILSENRLNY